MDREFVLKAKETPVLAEDLRVTYSLTFMLELMDHLVVRIAT
jgi:hypothetical protein